MKCLLTTMLMLMTVPLLGQETRPTVRGLQSQLGELERRIAELESGAAKAAEEDQSRPIIDYSNGDQLAGTPGVVDGTVLYYLQWPGGSYTRQKLSEHLATVPDGGYVLWDTEPWLHRKEGSYQTGDEETNLALFRAYADTLWHFGPELRRRKITIHVYQAPVILSRHFTVIRRGPGNSSYEGWEANQRRVLWQAEQAGMLEALRACKGGVALPLYVPPTWSDGRRWGGNLGLLIEHLGRVLDEQNVPHVWMTRPDCAGKPLASEHVEAILTRAGGRVAIWGTVDAVGWDEFRAAIEKRHN